MTMILYTCRPKTGTITVSKVITGAPEDMTVFRCTLTGQSEYPTIYGPFDLSQESPAVCKDLPYDTYVLTEEVQDGYTQTSEHDPIVLTRANRNQSVTVVNEVAAQALELTFDNIANVPVADAASVSDWNTLFFTSGTGIPFTETNNEVNIVKLIGGSNISLWSGVLNDYANNGALLSITDNANCISSLTGFAFDYRIGLISASLPALVNGNNASYVFSECISLQTALLPNLLDMGGAFFANCNALEYVDLSSIVTFGDMSMGEGRVFQGVSGTTITLKIPAHFMTDNGGLPHEEIQYLQASNTVTIITI